ncbi:hypothetical protein [Agrobacterium tumefaciens]|uniref:hypothetical protein n=1 Tax=Agrobacterium tumefaciens TaxID=358 RepID=UPI002861FB87|nr:hypothetical protein [Agrobacterium tumefaciens]MDR6587415.1 hypothetical protein [Agrobacterium tumefaciens]
MSAITWTPERHAQIDIAAGRPGDVQRQQFEASIRAQFDGDDDAFLRICRWFQAYHAEMTRLGYEYGSPISSDTCDTEIVFRKIMTDDEKIAAWASIEERMAKAGVAWA